MAELQTRQPIDTEAMRALIAKVKKGYAENAEAIATEISERLVNDELLQQQIEDVAVQTDWEQDDVMALDYLKNKPTTITDAEIEALFI